MSIKVYHSREKPYKGSFGAKVVLSDYLSALDYFVKFCAHDKIVSDDTEKMIVESIYYIFKIRIYPIGTLANNPDYTLIVTWIFDDESEELDTHKETLTKGQWNLLEHIFKGPSYEGKNLLYAKTSIQVEYDIPGEEITSYFDDVMFYPYIIDQSTLMENGRYWISILKGYQFIDGMGHRVVKYESDLDTLGGFITQIFERKEVI